MTRWRLNVLAATMTAALAVPGVPAAGAGLDPIERGFQDWAARHHIGRAVLAVAYQDRLVLATSYGGMPPDAPVLLASLSKAVTAVCTATLVDAGRLAFDTPVGEALAPFFQRYGDPADPRIKAITITDLLVHRVGFDRDHDDPVIHAALIDHLRVETARRPAMDEFLARALRVTPMYPPGQAFHYTNTGYLMLGVAIETAAGRPYEDYCRDAVLRPLGLGGVRLHPAWEVLSSFAGWRMNGPQYLRFLESFEPKSRILGPQGRAFLEHGDGKWISDKHDVYYALGVMVRPLRTGGYNTWHSGSFRHDSSTTANGILYENIGTYAVRYARPVSWFAAFSPQLDDGSGSDLDRVMGKAVGAIRDKDWPTGDLYPQFGLGR